MNYYGNGTWSAVLPDVVVDCMFKTMPMTALTSSMCNSLERAFNSASVTVLVDPPQRSACSGQ